MTRIIFAKFIIIDRAWREMGSKLLEKWSTKMIKLSCILNLNDLYSDSELRHPQKCFLCLTVFDDKPVVYA